MSRREFVASSQNSKSYNESVKIIGQLFIIEVQHKVANLADRKVFRVGADLYKTFRSTVVTPVIEGINSALEPSTAPIFRQQCREVSRCPR